MANAGTTPPLRTGNEWYDMLNYMFYLSGAMIFGDYLDEVVSVVACLLAFVIAVFLFGCV